MSIVTNLLLIDWYLHLKRNRIVVYILHFYNFNVVFIVKVEFIDILCTIDAKQKFGRKYYEGQLTLMPIAHMSTLNNSKVEKFYNLIYQQKVP